MGNIKTAPIALAELRNSLHDLKISSDNVEQYIWIKKLQNILNADIHRRPLGCKIDNTHIKIGDVHMESFYEARILFSHARWVDYFTRWLKQQVEKDIDEIEESKELHVFLIGYETYIEPILHSLRWKLINSHSNWDVRYGIYEESKFLQSTGDKISDVRIRFLDRNFPAGKTYTEANTRIVNICGISSTLSTFSRIDEEIYIVFKKELERTAGVALDDYAKRQLSAMLAHTIHYALIQVLPSNPLAHNQWIFADKTTRLKWDLDSTGQFASVTAFQKNRVISAKFLTSVSCFWNNADQCRLCYPRNGNDYYPFGERPIIATSETSMVPIQMIDLTDELNQDDIGEAYETETNSCNVNEENPSAPLDNKPDFIDFFEYEKSKNGNVIYKYRDYLYSGHISRMDNHFKYFIRTGALFQKILEDSKSNPENNPFRNFCDRIKNCLFSKGGSAKKVPSITDGANNNDRKAKTVDIIISTTNYSDNAFANAINEYVFDNQAHMISLDPKKEFRSNFRTKYSNISYFIEQTKSNDHEQIQIRFFFIDDQIIVGDAFYRTRSLVQSLMAKKDGTLYENTKIFEAVIVLLSRNSRSTKADYVSDPNKFFSLISINVPSVRSYADSCPLCKLRSEASAIAKQSVLSYTERYWMKKSQSYELKTLKDARNDFDTIEKNNPEKLNRQFRRFHCENILWEALGRTEAVQRGSDPLAIGETIITTIKSVLTEKDKIGRGKKYQLEYLIGFINALSKPFLYFKENNKKVALQFAIQMIEKLCSEDVAQEAFLSAKTGAIKFEFTFSSKSIELSFPTNKICYGIYSLLVTLINCLAAMDSTYLLHVEKLQKILELGRKLAPDLCKFPPVIGQKYHDFSPKPETGQKKNEKKAKDDARYDSPYLYEVLFQAIKRVLSGISSNYKRQYFETQLENQLQEKYVDSVFWRALYLENGTELSGEGFLKQLDEALCSEDNLLYYNKISAIIKDAISAKSNSIIVKDVFFSYADSSLEHKFRLINPPEEDNRLQQLISSLEKADLSTCVDNGPNDLVQLGYDLSVDSKCLITVYLDYSNKDSDHKSGSPSQKSSCSKVPDISEKPKNIYFHRGVFLEIDYSVTENDYAKKGKEVVLHDVLKFIVRPALFYRHKLSEIFSMALSTNAIKGAIQAAGASVLLKTQKTVSHEASRDVQSVFYIMDRVYKERNYSLTYRCINHIMNLCISLLNNSSKSELYFNIHSDRIHSAKTVPLLNGECCLSHEDIDFIEWYLSAISETSDANHKELMKLICNNGNDQTKRGGGADFNTDVEINVIIPAGVQAFCNTLNDFKYGPLIFDPAYGAPAMTTLVGFLDLLVRNAQKHGRTENKKVPITIEVKNNSDSLVLTVRNPSRDSKKYPKGITWDFFQEINSRKVSMDGICISTRQQNDYSTSGEFITDITITRKYDFADVTGDLKESIRP